MAQLVIIVGPIASGKSTVAAGLAGRLRQAGRTVAVLDLDDVVDTVGGFVGLTDERFRQAQLVHGRLVGAWLRQDSDVIAPGPFFERHEREALVHDLPSGTRTQRVLLLSTYEVALGRVRREPERLLSRQPELLRVTYERVASLLPSMPTSDWTFDTATTPSEAIVDELAASVLG